MKTLTFSNGDKMPQLGLGTWKSAQDEVYKAVRVAIEAGYRHIDCAAIYMNEDEIGKALRDSISAGDVKREELWITSKLWNNAHQTDDIKPAIEKTLKDLQLEYLDLYLVHWPVALKSGVIYPEGGDSFHTLEEIPIAATWKGMEELHKERLAKHIGVSNFSIKKIGKLLETAEIKPEMNQVESHPYLQQWDLFNYCKSQNIHFTAYSPLGSGDRPPAIKGENEPSLLENPIIENIADQYQASPANILVAWALQRGTSVIPKSVNPQRIKENLRADLLVIGDMELEIINALDRHYRYIDGSFWAQNGSPYTIENLWDE